MGDFSLQNRLSKLLEQLSSLTLNDKRLPKASYGFILNLFDIRYAVNRLHIFFCALPKANSYLLQLLSPGLYRTEFPPFDSNIFSISSYVPCNISCTSYLLYHKYMTRIDLSCVFWHGTNCCLLCCFSFFYNAVMSKLKLQNKKKRLISYKKNITMFCIYGSESKSTKLIMFGRLDTELFKLSCRRS